METTWTTADEAPRESALLRLWSSGFLPTLVVFAFVFVVERLLTRAPTETLLEVDRNDPLRQAFLGTAYLLAAIRLFGGRTRFSERLGEQWPIALFAGLVIASTLWSAVPPITLRRSIHVGGMLLVGLALTAPEAVGEARERAAQRFFALLRPLLATALVLSVVWSVALPDQGIDPVHGTWRGLYSHKNNLGVVAMLAAGTWAPVMWRGRSSRERLVGFAWVALALAVGFAANSKTSQAGFLIALAALAFTRLRVPAPLKLVAVPLLGAFALLWFLNFSGVRGEVAFEAATGRDLSFTGRTELWAVVAENAWRHPILGEGYNGFWVAGNARAAWIPYTLGWGANQGHDAYLDLLNETGLVGLAIFLAIVVRLFAGTLRLLDVDPLAGDTALVLAISILAHNVGESALGQGTQIPWLVFLVLAQVTAVMLPRPGEARAPSP